MPHLSKSKPQPLVIRNRLRKNIRTKCRPITLLSLIVRQLCRKSLRSAESISNLNSLSCLVNLTTCAGIPVKFCRIKYSSWSTTQIFAAFWISIKTVSKSQTNKIDVIVISACPFALFQMTLYFQLVVNKKKKFSQLSNVMISEIIPGKIYPALTKPGITLVAVSMHKKSSYFVAERKMVQNWVRLRALVQTPSNKFNKMSNKCFMGLINRAGKPFSSHMDTFRHGMSLQ